MQLNRDSEIARTIASGEVHVYELAMDADQLVEVVAYQLDVDVAVAFQEPGASEPVLVVDSPTGRQGPERLLAVSRVAGTHRVEVRAIEEEAPDGAYRLIIKELRSATEKDRQRAAAEQVFVRAEGLYLQGRDFLVSARELYLEAREMWAEAGEREREADTLLRLGWVHQQLKEYGPTIAFLEEARDIYRELGQGVGEGMALNSLGGAWIELDREHEALPLIEQALEISRGIDHRLLQADTLNNLGIVLNRLGRTDEAIDAYTRARKLFEELGSPQLRARIRFNLAILLVKRGHYESAVDNLTEVVEIRKRLGQTLRAARALRHLGDVRKRQGKLDLASSRLEESLALCREVQDPLEVAKTLNVLGTLRLLRKDFDLARNHYEEALRLFTETENIKGQAAVLVRLGHLQVETGDPEGALEFHKRALPILQQANDRTIEASNHYSVAKASHDLEEFGAAREHLEKAIKKVEELRADTINSSLRIAYFATRQHYFELYTDVLMHLGDEEAAFAAGERRRARALLEALGNQTDDIQEQDADLLRERQALQTKTNELEQRLTALQRQPEADQEEISEIKKERRAMLLKLADLHRKFQEELIQIDPPDLAEIQGLLSPTTLLLAYSLGDERSFLWRVSQESLKSYVLPGREVIEEDALAAHRLLVSRNEDDDELRKTVLAELSETLLGQLAAELQEQRLLIVAEGALLQLPFGALPGPPGMQDAPDYLVRRHEIVYLPSASVLRSLRRRAAERFPAPKQLAIFADPVFVPRGEPGGQGGVRYQDQDLQRSVRGFGQLRPLPNTRVEADSILKVARGEVLQALGYEATKEKVLESGLGDYKILHFATHGLVHREHPELSGLVFSLFDEQGESLDGFLRLHEIYNLRISAEMVVLSACQTGVGHQVRGEGFLGLTRGFFHAGSTRLVVSLWSVDDLGTAELMKRFYWSLLEGGASPALALHNAQRSMLASAEWQHPSFWAGFVFQGEWWPPGEEPPIGGAHAGGVEGDEIDPDLPVPDTVCEDLPEPWMQELCTQLRDLGGD